MSNQVMMDCERCGKPTVHLEPGVSHVAHLLISVLTVGIWIPFWIMDAALNKSRARCTVCGGKVSSSGWVGLFLLVALVVGAMIYMGSR